MQYLVSTWHILCLQLIYGSAATVNGEEFRYVPFIRSNRFACDTPAGTLCPRSEG